MFFFDDDWGSPIQRHDEDEETFFNADKSRTVDNTPISAYNCGGYALGLYSWYTPYDPDEVGYFSDIVRAFNADREEMLKEMVQTMLEEVPGLRRIESEIDLNSGEVLILFRLRLDRGYDDDSYCDGDFHFIRKDGGRFSHKPGGTAIQEISEEEAFGPIWPNGYDGPIVLLALSEDAALKTSQVV